METFQTGIDEFLKQKKSEDPIKEAVKALKLKPIGPATATLTHAESTTDYTIFRRLKSNRKVDKAHVRKLVLAIRKKNLLHLNPILVNSDMDIIDGQHRLAAAKELKVPIFFRMDQYVNEEDISGMNSVKKNWTLSDYLNFYTQKEVRGFRDFSDLCKAYTQYTPSMMLSICSKEPGKHTSEIQQGFIDLLSSDECVRRIQMLTDFIPYSKFAQSSRFVEAFLYILYTAGDDYNHIRMMAKAESAPFLFVPCANKRGYIKMLESIYNRGVREQNIQIFLKR